MMNFDTSPPPSADNQPSTSPELEMSTDKFDHVSDDSHPLQNILVDLSIILMAFLWVFLIIALLSFSMNDPAWSRTTLETTTIHNIMGKVGAYTADVLYYLFGLSAWWINCFLFVLILNWLLIHHLPNNKDKPSFSFVYASIGFVVLSLISAILEPLFFAEILQHRLPLGAGGLIGNTLAPLNNHLIVKILLITLLIGSLLLVFQTSWFYLLKKMIIFIISRLNKRNELIKDEQEKTSLKAQSITQTPVIKPNVAISNREIQSKKITSNNPYDKKKKFKEVLPPTQLEPVQCHEVPILSLLKKPFKKIYLNKKEVKQSTIEHAAVIATIFSRNQVENRIIKADIGPRFINYHIQLNLPIDAEEIKQSCLELTHHFKHKHVFLNQASPTSADYHLLIAREKPENVSLMEIFAKNNFADSNENLMIALGKDTYHKTVLVSLGHMPNLLITGNNQNEITLATKAVMASLIARHTSTHLKMILMGKYDNHFGHYLNLPHLITPFINRNDWALNVLRWCSSEAKKRLEILKYTQSKNINELNQKIYQACQKNILMADPFSQDLDNPTPLAPLSFLVIVIDNIDWLESTLSSIGNHEWLELMGYSQEIGIHWVLAQSTPSNILSNQILKYYFPTRLSFQVNCAVESLLSLNQKGAENLLGKGDALLLTPHSKNPIRLQVGNLSKKEYFELLGNFQTKQLFDDNIIHFQAKHQVEPTDQELYNTAVKHVLNTHKTSISFLQRRMSIGYNLAHQLLKQMEENGVLSKASLGGKREILTTHTYKYKREHK